jgi:cation transport protein ChaC
MTVLTRALIEARLPLTATTGAIPATVPEAELRRGMQHILDQRRMADGIWMFAYGALIWQGRAHDAARAGTVEELVRRYCIWDNRNRGTVAQPALTLGLERQPGACAGVAFHLAEEGVQEALWTVWKQEMSGGYYTAEWVEVATEAGPVAAVTFVADPRHPLYAGAVPEAEAVDLLAEGVGPGGTAASYLLQTADALRAWGIPDAELERYEAAVARRLGPERE